MHFHLFSLYFHTFSLIFIVFFVTFSLIFIVFAYIFNDFHCISIDFRWFSLILKLSGLIGAEELMVLSRSPGPPKNQRLRGFGGLEDWWIGGLEDWRIFTDFHRFSLIFIDFEALRGDRCGGVSSAYAPPGPPRIFKDMEASRLRGLEAWRLDFHCIFIHFHWFSLNFHKFSLIFIDFDALRGDRCGAVGAVSAPYAPPGPPRIKDFEDLEDLEDWRIGGLEDWRIFIDFHWFWGSQGWFIWSS